MSDRDYPDKPHALTAGEYVLRTNGVLFPDPDVAPVMHCADCGLQVALFYNHEPGIKRGKGVVNPGLVWGEDVTVICLCCSSPGCPHRGKTEAA